MPIEPFPKAFQPLTSGSRSIDPPGLKRYTALDLNPDKYAEIPVKVEDGSQKSGDMRQVLPS